MLLTRLLHSGNATEQNQPTDEAQGNQKGSQTEVSLVPVGAQVGHHGGNTQTLRRELVVSAQQRLLYCCERFEGVSSWNLGNCRISKDARPQEYC